jgi:hypothetical protein
MQERRFLQGDGRKKTIFPNSWRNLLGLISWGAASRPPRCHEVVLSKSRCTTFVE